MGGCTGTGPNVSRESHTLQIGVPTRTPAHTHLFDAPAGIASLTQLTALDLHIVNGIPTGLMARIASQLTRVQHLHLSRLDHHAWAKLPLFTALRQLGSLGLGVGGRSGNVRLEGSALLPVLPSSGGSVRRLELRRLSGEMDELPLALLAGLEALELAHPVQASCCQLPQLFLGRGWHVVRAGLLCSCCSLTLLARFPA